jgi:hypothetical protein
MFGYFSVLDDQDQCEWEEKMRAEAELDPNAVRIEIRYCRG